MTSKYLLRTLFCLFLLSVSVFTQRLVFDPSFTPTVNGIVEHLELLSDGKMLIVGDFTAVNGVARKEIARLNADGSLDMSFNADWLGGGFGQGIEISAMKVLPDGKILVAGELPYDGSSGGPKRVRRLNADGSADATQTAAPRVEASSGIFEIINKVEQLPNGKILLCGDFGLANNNPQPNLARYNNDGTYDLTFTTTVNQECNDLEVLPDGKYIVAGWFDTVNGTARNGLLRFNSDDSVDPSFVIPTFPNGGAAVTSNFIKLFADGSLIVSLFPVPDINARIARLNPDGSLRQFLPGNGWRLLDVLIQPNGKTLLSIDENFRRVNTDGSDDPSLPRMNFNGSACNTPHEPRDMAFTADGKIVVAGTFTSFFINGAGTTNRSYLARLAPEAIPIKPKFDFDGDGRDDPAVFRPGNQAWYLNQSTAGFYATQFGLSTDKPIAADYDGDGRADIAVFRDGFWYWLRSSDSVFNYRLCGQAGDIPQPSNFNAYCLVYRPSAAKFYTQQPFYDATPVEFPNITLLPTDKPVVADYDGDGRDDLAVFRDGNWFVRRGFSSEVIHYQFGLAGDTPVVADYDGDGRADYAVYRPSEGIWYIHRTTEGFFAVRWGLADDLPVPADYDGDGRTDIAVYRPSDGVWYELRSSGTYHFERFGLANDIPAQAR